MSKTQTQYSTPYIRAEIKKIMQEHNLTINDVAKDTGLPVASARGHIEGIKVIHSATYKQKYLKYIDTFKAVEQDHTKKELSNKAVRFGANVPKPTIYIPTEEEDNFVVAVPSNKHKFTEKDIKSLDIIKDVLEPKVEPVVELEPSAINVEDTSTLAKPIEVATNDQDNIYLEECLGNEDIIKGDNIIVLPNLSEQGITLMVMKHNADPRKCRVAKVKTYEINSKEWDLIYKTLLLGQSNTAQGAIAIVLRYLLDLDHTQITPIFGGHIKLGNMMRTIGQRKKNNQPLTFFSTILGETKNE